MTDFTPQQTEQLHSQLREYLGETVCAALHDKTVTDIKCSDGIVWLTTHQRGNEPTQTFLPEYQRRLAINTMASLLGKTCNAETPDLEGNLYGARITAMVPPSSQEPAFFIRRFAPEVFTFGHYLEQGSLTVEQVQILIRHIENRSNILFCGGTGSGKTTLLNTCAAELVDSPEHVVSIEDTPELMLKAKNVSRLYTTKTLTLRHQIKECLRMFPQRIIVGEVRDGAALEMMDAMNTGHRGGMATIHADSAEGARSRLSLLCRQVSNYPHWELIDQTFDLICYMELVGQKRILKELREVKHDRNIATKPIRLEHNGTHP